MTEWEISRGPMFIRLTGFEGNEVWVNVERIVAFLDHPEGKGCNVKLGTGGQPLSIRLQGTCQDVVAVLKRTGK